MKTGKGTQTVNTATMAVLAIVVAVMIVLTAENQLTMFQTAFSSELTGIVAARIASGVYALDSYPGGEVEMDLRQEYRIIPKENGEKVRVEMAESTEVPGEIFQVMDLSGEEDVYATEPFYVDSDVNFQEMEVQKICVVKNGGSIEMRGGSC